MTLVGSHLGERLAQGFVAVEANILVDIFRIDDAAVAQGNTVLLFIEVGLVQALDGIVFHRFAVQQALDDTALQEVLGDNLRDVFFLHAAVKAAFRIHHHNGAQSAQAETAGFYNLYLLLKANLFNFFVESLNDFCAARGSTSGTAADKYMSTIHCSLPSFFISRCNRWCTR